MRALVTIASGFAACLVLLTLAGALIGPPVPGADRPTGLTAATILGSDDTPPAPQRNPPPPSS